MGRLTETAPVTADVEAILAELKALGSEAGRAGMARFGINTAHAYGVSMTAMKPLVKRLGRDHARAPALWATEVHEARILAALTDDPKQVAPPQMDAWVADFDSWDLCDQVCMKLFARTPFAEEKIAEWAADGREFVRRAAFALAAGYAVHARKTPDDRFPPMLDLIERAATDPRNFVRKAVNWALRQIGKRSTALHGPALAVADRLAASADKTARWIGKDAARELRDPKTAGRIKPSRG